jgi:predicted Rossmann fold flavoprotein
VVDILFRLSWLQLEWLSVLHSRMRLIVIGGGAAGFFCAVNAARMSPSLEVIIVEKTGKLLSKVRISGGGRCNVTHACFSIEDMAKRYPRGAKFVKKTFYQFFTRDTIDWFAERGVQLKKEADGRMFPVTDTSETIIRCLLNEADQYGVNIKLNREVKKISKIGEMWHLTYANGEEEQANFLCVACGGYPKSSMFQWLRDIGHTIEEPVPSLFTFNIPKSAITNLMGISTTAKVKIQGTKFIEEGPVLITHWGLSGPAVLRLSARAARELHARNYRFTVAVNWCPEMSEQFLRDTFGASRETNGSQRVLSRSRLDLPQRLWEYLCLQSQIGEQTRWADLPAAKQNALIKNLTNHELTIEGKTTFKEEFVTAGGIRLSELNHATMESKLQPRLYFAGEILDVDGVTGGFNFQHAWTSGWIAARAVSSRP